MAASLNWRVLCGAVDGRMQFTIKTPLPSSWDGHNSGGFRRSSDTVQGVRTHCQPESESHNEFRNTSESRAVGRAPLLWLQVASIKDDAASCTTKPAERLLAWKAASLFQLCC